MSEGMQSLAVHRSTKLPNSPQLISTTSQFIAFTQTTSPNVLRIKELRGTPMDIIISYQSQLTDVISSQCCYIVVATVCNEVEVLRLEIGEQVQINRCLAVRKKFLSGLWLQNSMLVIGSGRNQLEVIQFDTEHCLNRRKHECSVCIKDVAIAPKCLYVLSDDGSVSQLDLQTGHRSELLAPASEEQKCVRIRIHPTLAEEDHLICAYPGHIDLFAVKGAKKLLSVSCCQNSTVYSISDFIAITASEAQDTICKVVQLHPNLYLHGMSMHPLSLMAQQLVVQGKSVDVRHSPSETTQAPNKRHLEFLQVSGQKLQYCLLPLESPDKFLKQEKPSSVGLSPTLLEQLGRLMDQKLSPLYQKIESLCRRVSQLETKLSGVYEDAKLQTVYKESLKEELSSLLEHRIIPCMEEHFQLIYSKLSELTQQGIDYYNYKLRGFRTATGGQLKILLQELFKSTRTVVQHIKQQCASIATIEQNLLVLEEMKSQLIRKTDTLLNEIRKGPFGLQLGDFQHVIPTRDKFIVKT